MLADGVVLSLGSIARRGRNQGKRQLTKGGKGRFEDSKGRKSSANKQKKQLGIPRAANRRKIRK